MYLPQRRKDCAGRRSGDAKLGVCFSSEISFFAPFRLRIRHSGESRNPGAAVRGRLGGKIFPRVSDFVTLTKPEITFLVLLAAAVGSIMASASVNLVSLFHALFGTALVASGAAALNQYLERFHDATMRRTANRSVPAGRLSPREALYFGTGLSASGTLYLALSANALTSMIGLIALLSYLLVYTPLK